MKNRLQRLALVTSPILAIYGAVPVYLFTPVPLFPATVGVMFLTVLILLFWLINIWLVQLHISDLRRYALSGVASLLLHSLIILFIPNNGMTRNSLSFLAYPMIGTLAIDAIILVIIHVILLEEKKKITETENRNLRLFNMEAQKMILLQQLQPHFLFNALSALKSIIREDPARAEMYTIKLSEFLRYSVDANASALTTLDKELQFTEDYIALQQARFGQAINFSVQVPDMYLHRWLPVFSIQPIVENAIKHNSFSEKYPLEIRLDISDGNIRVSNNKKERPVMDSPGTGLKNLSARYQLHGGSAPIIEDLDDQFIVNLQLFEHEDRNH